MFGKGGDGQDVVSMTQRGEARKLAPLRVVEAYWHALCDGHAVPLRSDVDPRGMESALENAFLLERIAPSLAKIRVAGSHMADLMGMQVAGMPLSTLVATEDRDAFGDAVAKLFAEPAIIRLSLTAQEGFGRPALKGHMLLMPLRSDFGEVTRALGALVTDGRLGRTPRRFRLGHVEVEPVRPVERPRREDRAADPAGAASDPVRPAAASQAIGAAEIQRGHLRLVVSND